MTVTDSRGLCRSYPFIRDTYTAAEASRDDICGFYPL